jgi:hypothetical protein
MLLLKETIIHHINLEILSQKFKKIKDNKIIKINCKILTLLKNY